MDVHPTKDGFEIAQLIAREFITGLGFDQDRLEYRRLGTPAELLNLHRPDLKFTVGFSSDESCYHEANLKGSENRALIGYEIADHIYPIIFKDGSERIHYELLQRRHTRELHRQVLAGMEVYGSLFAAHVSQKSIFLPDAVDALMRPLFPGIYPPGEYESIVLYGTAVDEIKADDRMPNVDVLELGCGSGFDAVALVTELGIKLDCVDVDPLAVANTRAQALLAGVEHMIDAWQSDVLNAVSKKYHYIIFNAPLAVEYQSSRTDRHDSKGRVIGRALSSVHNNLYPGGQMLLMGRRDISSFLPSTLCAQRIYDFSRRPLAIHSITVK